LLNENISFVPDIYKHQISDEMVIWMRISQ
jgi:hypothetical protein